jgi:hypothetical protein
MMDLVVYGCVGRRRGFRRKWTLLSLERVQQMTLPAAVTPYLNGLSLCQLLMPREK